MISLDVDEVVSAMEGGESICTRPEIFLEARERLGLEVHRGDDPYEPPTRHGCGGKED